MEFYRNNNMDLHREHGPAVVTPNLILYAVHGKLHRVDGPAVISSNGSKVYYWKHVQIEPSLWNSKDTISVAEVLSIPNVEIRRCMIEMIGYAELIRRGGNQFKVLDEDMDTGAILFRLDMPENDKKEPVVVVKVLDGTPVKDANGKLYRKEYFLRVPPDYKTCKEAIAWTFAMDPKEYYRLEEET